MLQIEAQGTVDDLVLSVAVYGRTQGCAVVGGAVYEGQFIYADFCTSKNLVIATAMDKTNGGTGF